MELDLKCIKQAEKLYQHLDFLENHKVSYNVKASIYIDEPLDEDFYKYLIGFASTIKHKYDIKKVEKSYGGKLENSLCYFGDYGIDGEYIIYTFISRKCLVGNEDSLPGDIPSKRCPFMFVDDQNIVNNGQTKDHYMEWAQYLINHFFEPNGYFLNGTIQYKYKEGHVFYVINIKNNVISCENHSVMI